jgi:hypothetical protein
VGRAEGEDGQPYRGGVVKVYDFDQRSPEWHAIRIGMFTASCAGDMLATIKSGEAAARRDHRTRPVGEPNTHVSQENGFVSADMQRGTDMEPHALAAYETLTGHMVRAVGFVRHDTLRAGYSPDGVIGNFDGLLELKCPKSATHLGYLKGKTLPKDYTGQIMHALWITGAQWVDFVSFDDRFPAPLQVFHVRVERNEKDIAAYELLATQFLAEIDRDVAEVEALAAAVAA